MSFGDTHASITRVPRKRGAPDTEGFARSIRFRDDLQLLHLAQLAPALVLFRFGRIRILFALEPKSKPIQIPLINLIAMDRLVDSMELIEEKKGGNTMPKRKLQIRNTRCHGKRRIHTLNG